MSYAERTDAQDAALETLRALGWTYLPPAERRALTAGPRRPILEPVLDAALARINTIRHRGHTAPFSAATRAAAIGALRDLPDRGLGPTSQAAYELLTLGEAYEETVGGDRLPFTLRYVDWERPERNTFHVSDEVEVLGPGGRVRADVVLYVNGIPFGVIECKRRDRRGAMAEALAQLWRYQEQAPRLFHTAQVVLGGHPNAVRYGTSGTPPAFFSVWHEPAAEAAVGALLGRTPTAQDRTLWALCRPARLLDLAYRYVVFDAGTKKIARHQQVAAVEATLDRVRQRTEGGRRAGGVIWHTQGSGKSITMVLLFKALALQPDLPAPRVLLVTDRVNLDEQIQTTFAHCGKAPARARSGRHLRELLTQRRADVVTTVLDKFHAALDAGDLEDPSSDLFVLVDEAHRSQYGRMHAAMRQALPNACFIAFTGTPIARADRHTAARFGDFIHTYTIDEAVRDEAVVPLFYESRAAELSVNKRQIDRGFDRVAEGLAEYHRRELQDRAARKSALYGSEQVVEEIAHDIAGHYAASWKGTGWKAQLTVARKETAVRYLRAFQAIGAADPSRAVDARVVVSPPGRAEGDTLATGAPSAEDDAVAAFWAETMAQWGTAEAYEAHTLDSFKHDPSGVELLIVVDKLLTGFDAPTNTVLYIARSLTGHTLLQAIARVNRVADGKDAGLIVDYWGLLGPLDQALTEYAALAEFDEADLAHTLTDIAAEVAKLPQRHADVDRLFAGVRRDDTEALERHLDARPDREEFYERLSAFGRTLHLAHATLDFSRDTPRARVERYDADLRRWRSLRRSLQDRHAERLDHAPYEPRIRRLLDRHVTVDDVLPITEQPVDIFDPEAFLREVERAGHSKASKADIIASQVVRSLRLRIDENPERYRSFSQRLEEAIAAFRQAQIDAAAYLRTVRDLYDDLVHSGRDTPARLRRSQTAAALFASLRAAAGDALAPDALADVALSVETAVEPLLVVDWTHNPVARAAIEDAAEDALLAARAARGLDAALTFDVLDRLLHDYLAALAVHRA